ncbi:alpha/beta-hydrolase [Aspergillus sergii]|uniref:Alpha/beta-hydrolase n=1 Tax=Aspergillus sergii TaxID=1034303 RepID=A0A5N6XDT7_9EURO|nr:alpha/beta-hydrolase [Aspergillus sergii]
MASKPTLSTLEWLRLGIAILHTISRSIAAIAAIPFRLSKGPPSFSRHVAFAISRAYVHSVFPKALVAITPSTEEVYCKFVASQGLEAQTITLSDGSRAHWLGNPSAEKVLLFFHGGGYLMSAVAGHFHLLHQTIREVEQKGGKLAVLFLSYDVSFQAPYPRQLQQATEVLRHTLTALERKPENIFLAGDSAGGNLALGLLSHILHPHHQIARLDLSSNLAGLVLLSPWVTFTTTSHSIRKNQYRDILAAPVLNNWSAIFKGTAQRDSYLEPLSAPADWWRSLPVGKVQIIAGTDEVFVDDIEKFAEQLERMHPETVLNVVPDEAHDHAVMEFVFNEKRSGQRAVFERWVLDMVSGDSVKAL